MKGISLTFMTIDMLGGVFSVLSLAFKEEFEVLGGVAYSAVVVSGSSASLKGNTFRKLKVTVLPAVCWDRGLGALEVLLVPSRSLLVYMPLFHNILSPI